jgi:hypothetical protein
MKKDSFSHCTAAFVLFAIAQNRTITGKVTDDKEAQLEE